MERKEKSGKKTQTVKFPGHPHSIPKINVEKFPNSLPQHSSPSETLIRESLESAFSLDVTPNDKQLSSSIQTPNLPDKSLMPAHSEQPEVETSNAIWYLGIDFGTTAVSAVLLNQSTGQRYPIYWVEKGTRKQGLETRAFGVPPASLTTEVAGRKSESGSTSPQSQRSSPSRSGETVFRLPAVTYLGSAASKLSVNLPGTPIVVGSVASALAKNQPGILLENFKPFLNIAIPYYYPKHHEWEPILELPNQQRVSLYWVRRGLQALLATLTLKKAPSDFAIEVGAVGLESSTLERALEQLEGVVLGSPAAWGDTYRFNLREAVLEAKLVKNPDQIFFLEDAIACILAGLHRESGRAGEWENGRAGERESGRAGEWESGRVGERESGRAGEWESGRVGDGEVSKNIPVSVHSRVAESSSSAHSWRDGTLVVNVGATTTELTLVDLPDQLQDLSYSDFSLCSLPYAGHAINLDIFCQLLYPQMSVAQRQQLSLSDDLELPLPGQPDSQKRDRLVSLLQSTPLGRSLLKASGYLKLILQHKDEFTLNLGKEQWIVKRLDLESEVFLPFIQQLNRELNAQLIKTGLSEQGIYQVLSMGGTATLGLLKNWFQRKFPNATVIHETNSPKGSWVAAGLATLPLYPQVLNRTEQQYSDYFLLLELLRAFPETTDSSPERLYSMEEIMQQLEHRGLNTNACYERLVRLVEGQLPLGLVPSIEDSRYLSQASKQNPHYSTVASAGLFAREDDRLYRLNLQQQKRLCQYMNIVLSRSHQTFLEPLVVAL